MKEEYRPEVKHKLGTRFYRGRVVLVISQCDHNHVDPDVAMRCALKQLNTILKSESHK